jgi:hypothetical protein
MPHEAATWSADALPLVPERPEFGRPFSDGPATDDGLALLHAAVTAATAIAVAQ